MFDALKNHPFPVEAYFEHSIVCSFAAPKKELRDLIPQCLEIDSFNDEWGFIAVAMVQTKNLRPKGFPSFLGRNFFLIGYRVFVRFRNNAGRNLRGLYILKTETDKKRMTLLGNVFTHYRYNTTDISVTRNSQRLKIESPVSGLKLEIDEGTSASLPPHSPFRDWKEARRFAGPLPFTFSYDEHKHTVLTVEGVREDWTPEPVSVKEYAFPYLDTLNLSNLQLANCFIVRDVPYSWKKGKIEKWPV